MTAVADATPEQTPHSRAAAATPIRVLAVDDHPAVRSSLRRLLDQERDLEVVGVVAEPREALAVAVAEDVTVAVVDYHLGRSRNGLWLSRKLKRLPSPPRVLIYSAYCDSLLAAASVVAEADGIISKAALGAQLCNAIRGVVARRLALPVPPRVLEQTIRDRLDGDEQIAFGMLLGGVPREDLPCMLGESPAHIERLLSEMLRSLETVTSAHAPPAPSLSTARLAPPRASGELLGGARRVVAVLGTGRVG